LGSTPSPDDRINLATPPSTTDEQESPSQPPKKRRRITKDTDELKKEGEKGQPQYLDMSSAKIDGDEQEQLDKLMKVLHKRRKIGGLIYVNLWHWRP
jgi:NAD-dependent histone deacetylase SIR2